MSEDNSTDDIYRRAAKFESALHLLRRLFTSQCIAGPLGREVGEWLALNDDEGKRMAELSTAPPASSPEQP